MKLYGGVRRGSKRLVREVLQEQLVSLVTSLVPDPKRVGRFRSEYFVLHPEDIRPALAKLAATEDSKFWRQLRVAFAKASPETVAPVTKRRMPAVSALLRKAAKRRKR